MDVHETMVEPSGKPNAIFGSLFRLCEVDLDENSDMRSSQRKKKKSVCGQPQACQVFSSSPQKPPQADNRRDRRHSGLKYD